MEKFYKIINLEVTDKKLTSKIIMDIFLVNKHIAKEWIENVLEENIAVIDEQFFLALKLAELKGVAKFGVIEYPEKDKIN